VGDSFSFGSDYTRDECPNRDYLENTQQTHRCESGVVNVVIVVAYDDRID